MSDGNYVNGRFTPTEIGMVKMAISEATQLKDGDYTMILNSGLLQCGCTDSLLQIDWKLKGIREEFSGKYKAACTRALRKLRDMREEIIEGREVRR